MAKVIIQPSVKFSMRDRYYLPNTQHSMTNFGPFRSASKAANAFAAQTARNLYYSFPKPFPVNAVGISFIWDNPRWDKNYKKAYHRSLKIFKAMGLK